MTKSLPARRPLHSPVCALLWIVTLATIATPRASFAASDSLAASTQAPWNPPHAMPRRRAWEQAVLLPGRVLSLPLVGLGAISEPLLLRVETDPRFAYGSTPSPSGAWRYASLRTSRMGDRTGLGGAIALHAPVGRGSHTTTLSGEFAATLHHYNRTLLTWSGRPLALQYGYEWRPQERFYGLGMASRVSGVSGYSAQTEFVRAIGVWETARAAASTRTLARLSLWAGPRSSVDANGRERGTMVLSLRDPVLAAAVLGRREEHLALGAQLRLDRRTGVPHWGAGWRTQLTAERLQSPLHGLALHSGSSDAPSTTRLTAEAEAGTSFMRDPRTLRLLVRVSQLRASGDAGALMPSELSTLGGQAGLGGYEAGRFHDRDLALARLDYVFPLQRRFEMDLHSEWGAVHHDVWTDARFNTLRNSFGFEFRVRNDDKPRASMGLDFSPEATRLRFSIGGLE
jgi:hypothetical protein